MTSSLMRITNSAQDYRKGKTEEKYAAALRLRPGGAGRLADFGPSDSDGRIRRECYSGSTVSVRPSRAATLCLRAALSGHPTLIKGVYTGHLIQCDNRPESDSNLKPNTR